MRSKQDNKAVELLEIKTRQVEVSETLRNITPLLRKKDMPLFQATKEAVLPNLRSTEKQLARNPQHAKAYSEAIHQLVKAGAIKKLDPCEISDGESLVHTTSPSVSQWEELACLQLFLPV